MIIAKTFKGRNCGPDVENNMAYHGKPLGDKKEEAVDNLLRLIGESSVVLKNREPETTEEVTNGVEEHPLTFDYTVYE